MKSIEKRIEEAFTRYDSTIELLQQFIRKRSNVQEFILLVCARLDSFLNLAFTGKSQKDNFVDFLTHHSGNKTKLLEISVPDFFEHLGYHLWVLPGCLEKEGRFHMFDPRRDEQFVLFIWNSGIALTQEKVGFLLKFLMNALRRRYRVLPNQPLSKNSADNASNIVTYLEDEAKKHKKAFVREAICSNKYLFSLIKDFSLASLLYREYRCGIIHEYGVDIRSTDFFGKHDVYWQPFYNDIAEPTHRLRIQFPAQFLLKLLTNCVNSYKLRLQKTKQLPEELFFEICDFMNELKYLDERTIPEGKDVGVNIRSGQ